MQIIRNKLDPRNEQIFVLLWQIRNTLWRTDPFSLIVTDIHFRYSDMYTELCSVNTVISFIFHDTGGWEMRNESIPIPEHRCITVAVRCSWRSFHPHLPVIPLHLHFHLHVHFLFFLIRHLQNTLKNTFKLVNLLITSPPSPEPSLASSSPRWAWKGFWKMLRIE